MRRRLPDQAPVSKGSFPLVLRRMRSGEIRYLPVSKEPELVCFAVGVRGLAGHCLEETKKSVSIGNRVSRKHTIGMYLDCMESPVSPM